MVFGLITASGKYCKTGLLSIDINGRTGMFIIWAWLLRWQHDDVVTLFFEDVLAYGQYSESVSLWC